MKNFLLLISFVLISFSTQAQVIQIKGVGTVSYTSELSATIKEKAYLKAQLSAVERYFAENGESQSQNFESIQGKVEENLDKFILNTVVINEQDQSSFHKYTVSLRVELNVAKLNNVLSSSSAVGKSTPAGNEGKSQLVYIFVGRKADSVRAFDARVFQRVETSARTKGSSASAQTETGGSTTTKADEVTYKLLPMANFGTSITSVFSQNGFQVVDPTYVIGDKDFKKVNSEFSVGNDLAPPTMRSIVSTLRNANIPLFILATLDVGAPSQDPATGLARVGVTVTARVLDLTKTFPREVASVPAVQYFGVGPDNSAALTKGLKDASLLAAREVVSRLNALNVR